MSVSEMTTEDAKERGIAIMVETLRREGYVVHKKKPKPKLSAYHYEHLSQVAGYGVKGTTSLDMAEDFNIPGTNSYRRMTDLSQHGLVEVVSYRPSKRTGARSKVWVASQYAAAAWRNEKAA
jgi:hypothetical protein